MRKRTAKRFLHHSGCIGSACSCPGGTCCAAVAKSSAARLIEGAREAGLPVCATTEMAAEFEPGNRLPECEAERAKVAASKP